MEIPVLIHINNLIIVGLTLCSAYNCYTIRRAATRKADHDRRGHVTKSGNRCCENLRTLQTAVVEEPALFSILCGREQHQPIAVPDESMSC